MENAYTVVGKRVVPNDAYEKVTGRVKFAVDLEFPHMLYGKVLRSPHAHARIIHIDTSRAEVLPGVRAILTHRDVSDKEWVGVWANYRGPVLSDRVRFVGDEVAAVAADDAVTAERALQLMNVEYDVLPAVFDPKEAAAANAVSIREDGNVRSPSVIEWGDIAAGFNEADIVVEHTNNIGCQQQAAVGRNATIASWERDRVTIWASTQTPCEFRDIVADYLEIPRTNVRVIAYPVGVSFGLYWVNNIDLLTVLLARKVRAAVKVELSQEDTFAYVKRRHIESSQGRLGVRRDGTFTAIDLSHLFDNGGYGDKFDVYQSVADLWGGRCPNGRYKMTGVATNLVTSGCMRGVGDVTMNFNMEQLVDKAAEALDMDPVEIRIRNHTRGGEDLRSPSYAYAIYPDIAPPEEFVLSSSTLENCLVSGAKAIDWQKKWRGWGKPSESSGSLRRGVGVATACHICGLNYGGSTSAIVKVNGDGTAHLLVNMGRHGQGSETTQAQLAAEELGIAYENIRVVSGDTDAAPWGQGSTASTAAHLTGLATKAAAADAKRQILELAADHFETKSEDLAIAGGMVGVKGAPASAIEVAELLGKLIPEYLAAPIIIGRGMANVTNDKLAKHFAAHFVEVEVDVDTGYVTIMKYVAAHDSGTIINPGIAENQVTGGVMLGAGVALVEDLKFEAETGKVLNPNFLDYKVLGALDMPDPEVLFLETNDPVGPFGAKGLGEAPVGPVPAAIAQAVYNAIGVRVDPPITPEKTLRAMGRIDSV